MVCWPSAILRPAFSSSNSIGGSMMSTPTGILLAAGLLDEGGDLLGVLRHQAERGADRAAQAEQAGLAVLGLEPRRIEPVVHGGRAEVPEDRIGAALGQQRPAADLVALPLADLGGGEVADVVGVHHQQRAEVGLVQRLAGAGEPVIVQAAVVDALLEVDAHGAEGRQRASPVVARVDVLGADDVGLGRALLGHGFLPVVPGGETWRSVPPGATSMQGSIGRP